MKTNDYVKYLTKTVVEHWDTPKDERKRRKIERKQMQEPFTYRYFGIMPYIFKEGIKMMAGKKMKTIRGKEKNTKVDS